jgi:hypothetical protein
VVTQRRRWSWQRYARADPTTLTNANGYWLLVNNSHYKKQNTKPSLVNFAGVAVELFEPGHPGLRMDVCILFFVITNIGRCSLANSQC